MKLKLFALALFALASSAYAGCDRYFITYIENEDDLQGTVRDVVLGIQREDLKSIFAEGSRAFPSRCQYYINGFDLNKDQKGVSKLTRIYKEIAEDGSDAPVDFLTLTHGNGKGEIQVLDARYVSVEDAFLKDIPEALKKRLGVFVDFSCWGFSSSQSAIKAGFAAALGISVESLGPLLTRDFLTSYTEGKTLREVTEDLHYNCQNDDVWSIISRLVTDDRKEYCTKAAVKIIGNPDMSIDTTAGELERMRAEVKSSGKDMSYQANIQRKAPFLSKIEGSVQTGSNPANQLDLYTNNAFITRLSITSSGDYGYQFGLINQPHGKVLSFERDPKNSVLFSFTAASFTKNIFSIGKDYDNGWSWKYNLSVEGKAGYLRVRDSEGDTRNLANIGAKVNNELKIGYKALKLETNAGVDYLLFHNLGRQYADGSLHVQTGNVEVGAYGTYDSLTGSHAGLRASFSFGKSKTKKKK